MLNHASRVNGERMEKQMKKEQATDKQQDERDPVVMNGKRLSELTEEEMIRYNNEW